MKTIGLCMIVKNEAGVILRCLESVRRFVDYVLIEDTGSTDGTQDVIRDYLEREGLRGLVWNEPWRNFAHNRSVALARLREKKVVDYAFVMDADNTLVFEDGFDVARFKEGLSKDLYQVEIRILGFVFRRPLLLSNKRKFRFRGVLHEFVEDLPGGWSRGMPEGFHVLDSREGSRNQDPEKYRKDVRVLEQALQTEKDRFLRARYTFYLAQTYRDCGDLEKSISSYLERAKMGFWNQEVFWSFYCAAMMEDELGRPVNDVLETYAKATKAVPGRAEALQRASHLCRRHERFAEGYEIAKRGLAIPPPQEGLFVEAWIYEYGLLDEFAVNAYWSGHYDDCLWACERMLSEGKITEDIRERVEKNADFAREKIASQLHTKTGET